MSTILLHKIANVTAVKPYPIQGPFTAAMIGLNISIPLSKLFIVGFPESWKKVPALPFNLSGQLRLETCRQPCENSNPSSFVF